MIPVRRALAALAVVAAAVAVIPASPTFAEPSPKRCHTVSGGEKFCCPQTMMVIRVRGEEGVYGCKPVEDAPKKPATP